MFPFTTELLWTRRLGGQERRAGYNAIGRKRRDEDAECHSIVSMAIRIPVPFHGSANLERFPRTSESALGERDAGEWDCKQRVSDYIVDQFMCNRRDLTFRGILSE